jgi:hypothetical protein
VHFYYLLFVPTNAHIYIYIYIKFYNITNASTCCGFSAPSLASAILKLLDGGEETPKHVGAYLI